MIKKVNSIVIDVELDDGRLVTLNFKIRDGHPIPELTSLELVNDTGVLPQRTATLSFNYSAFELETIYH